MYFRADKRDFDIGSLVESAGEFISLNPQGSQDIEDVFESLRPMDKPTRHGNLYLFTDETLAKKHWSKMTDGKLYRATVDPTLSYHRGDMRLVDKAFEVRADIEAVEKIAIRYWAGDFTENPVVEVIVQHATISEVVSKDQRERIAYLKSWALHNTNVGSH